jgi:threonine dehydrogenase-like Zn-dependent dehydrogenase
MKIAVLRGPLHFEVVDAPIPAIEADGVLVRVAACGVCTSELHIWEGRNPLEHYPRYIGHEVSGTVEAIGPQVDTLKPGDPVGIWVVEWGYAEYVVVKAIHCYPAGEVPLELALAEPLACAVNTVELAHPSLGDDVVILGAGFMGNLVQKLVMLQGPRRILVADPRPDALERAGSLGADRLVDTSTQNLAKEVKAWTEGQGADIAFEVAGTQASLQALGEVTRMSGKVVIVGYHPGERHIPLGHWNWMAFQILNAHFREVPVILRGMQRGMRYLTSGRLSLDGLVSHRFLLTEINQAFQTACDKPEGFVKATIVM